jgi:hypothetical protein
MVYKKHKHAVEIEKYTLESEDNEKETDEH